jgi:hypothetical protein
VRPARAARPSPSPTRRRPARPRAVRTLARLLGVTAFAGIALAAATSSASAIDVGDVPADVVPPAVAGVTATPGTVDVSTGPAAVVVTAHLTDAVTGVVTAAVRLGAGDTVPLALLSGTAGDGTWSAAVTVPAGAPYGDLPATVTATDAAGNNGTGTVAALTVLDAVPAAPASATAVADGATLRVTWAAPPANGGSPVTGYTVTATPFAGLPVTATTAAGAVGTTVGGLAEDMPYVVAVAARNAAGPGAATAVDALTGVPTAPGEPAAVSAVPADGALTVTWAAPPTDGGLPVTAYEVRAATAPPVVVDAAATSAVLTGLANGTPYDVTVTARNDLGAGLPATVTATPRTVPGRPALGTVTAHDASADVHWTAPASDGGDPVHAYLVTASTGAVFTAPGTARNVTVGGLANGVPVSFTVTAVNAAGPGSASARSASVVPRRPVRLVVVALPAPSVVYGTVSTVRAAVRTVAGIGVPGARVELWAQLRPSTAWTRVASGNADSTGAITLRATLPATAALRLRHPADALSAGDLSVRGVLVAPRVTAVPSASTVRAGRTLSVHGSIAPARPAGAVVKLQRYTPSGWATVANGTMTTTTSYRVSWQTGAVHAWSLRVVRPADPGHTAGKSPTWKLTVRAETVTEVAADVLADRGITLDTVHSSGIVDAATARRDVVDLADGQFARRSSYQNAPGGSTRVSVRVLLAMRAMGRLGTITVSEVAGGSHAVGSAHYSGLAFDVRFVNGVHVAPGTAYGMAVSTCRSYGATNIYYPAHDPYGGHSNHVHCDWS